MTAQPQGRPAVRRAKAVWATMRFLVTLGLLLVLCAFAFLRDRPMPRRPSDQPPAWKLWLWCGVLVGVLGALASVNPHWFVHEAPQSRFKQGP